MLLYLYTYDDTHVCIMTYKMVLEKYVENLISIPFYFKTCPFSKFLHDARHLV